MKKTYNKDSTCILAFGSNLGEKMQYLTSAYREVNERIGKIVQSSPIFSSVAWGYESQGDFLNSVVEVKTKLLPLQVLEEIRQIEQSIGRQKRLKWHEREIDIDIIFYDDLILDHDFLKLPHPFYRDRNFVLQPLLTILPNWKDPVLNTTIQKIANQCTDTLAVHVYETPEIILGKIGSNQAERK